MALSGKSRGPGNRRVLSSLAATLVVSCAALSQARADIHCDADVYVKNRKPTAIKVLKFEYVTAEHGTADEDLANKRLAPGEEEEWNRQKLGKAAEGQVITATRVRYMNDTSGASNPSDSWGPQVCSMWHPHTSSYQCLDDRNYAHYIDPGESEACSAFRPAATGR